MKLKAIKTFMGNKEGLVSTGQTIDVDETRAKELIRVGLCEELVETAKAKKQESANKKAPDPDNKGVDHDSPDAGAS